MGEEWGGVGAVLTAGRWFQWVCLFAQSLSRLGVGVRYGAAYRTLLDLRTLLDAGIAQWEALPPGNWRRLWRQSLQAGSTGRAWEPGLMNLYFANSLNFVNAPYKIGDLLK